MPSEAVRPAKKGATGPVQSPFVKAGLYVVMLLGLVLFIWGLTVGDQLKQKLFIFCGIALFYSSLSIMGHKAPGDDHTWSIAVSAISVPFILVLAALIPFIHENWLARRCNGPKTLGAFEACQEILRTGQEILQRRTTRKLSPADKSKILNNMGSAYYHTDRYDLAIENYSSAIALDPSNAKAYMNRCGIFLAKGDVPAALKDCNDAIRFDPYIPTSYLMRGTAYFVTGRYEEAIRDFDRVLFFEPKNAPAFDARCEAHNMRGQTDLALADCNRSLALSPNDSITLNNRGFVYLKAGNYEAARADFDAAIKLEGKQAASLYGRGLIKRYEGDTAAANADIIEAIKLKPDIADDIALYGLGR